MSQKLLRVIDLVKEYPAPGQPLRVLDAVWFDLDAGASLAIMGPSGSGKSTLLNVLGALDIPTSGTVAFRDDVVHALEPDALAEFRNREVGFIFQDHHLLPQCTAIENVLLPCLAFGTATRELTDRARGLLDRIGLTDKAASFPAQLSGGERQRVAIARAMINLPALLLCDEPTGNLDAENGRRIGELIESLRRDHAIAAVVVTHNDGLAGMFERRLTLAEGKLHEQG